MLKGLTKKIPRSVRLALAILPLTGVLAALWAVWWEPSHVQWIEECVAIPWPSGKTLRAAVISDLHTGSPFNDLSALKALVKETNRQEPDVVFILGDLVIDGVWGGTFVPPEDIVGELKRLHAPRGVFAVLGNHDSWLDAPRITRALQQADIQVLLNQSVKIGKGDRAIWIAGLGDYLTQNPNIESTLNGTDDNVPMVLITHNPDVFPSVPSRVNLTIAGHTHGGQVSLPFIGRPIIPSKFGQRYAAGHIIEGGRHLHVATGIGTSIFPVRFRVPPTVPILTLKNVCP